MQSLLSFLGNRLIPTLGIATALSISGTLVATPVVPGQGEKKLTTTGTAGDAHGASVSVSGLTAVVGAPNESRTGAAYVRYRNRGGANAWGIVRRLVASDAKAGDEFGASVAVSGNFLLVGARGKSAGQGAVYVFSRDRGGRDLWGEVAKLSASDAGAGHRFGAAVSISGETAILGAPGNGVGAGYVFEKNAGGWDAWGEVTKIVASNGGGIGVPGNFGTSVSISSDTVLVGATDTGLGGAYVFERDLGGASNWGERKFLAGAAGTRFGAAVAINKGTMVVGAERASDRGPDSGAVFVFDRHRGGADNWGLVRRLLANDAGPYQRFGHAVAISSDLVVAGTQVRGAAGRAYAFSRHHTGTDQFGQLRRIVASDGANGDAFGTTVCARDGLLLVGAPGATIGGQSGQGAAYVFDLGYGVWCDLGYDLSGTHGKPRLRGSGDLSAGTTLTLTLSNARAQSPTYLAVGVSAANVPFLGGTLVPEPTLIQSVMTGGLVGTPARVATTIQIPGVVPTGIPLYFQHWVADPSGPAGFAATNALLGTTRTSTFREIQVAFDAMLRRAAPPVTSLRIYSKQDFTNQSFVRNPSCWAADLDLTGLSPWNQRQANRRAGTLVSPRHIVFAKHYPLGTTTGANEIVFVTAQNVTVTRKVIAVEYPAEDIGVALLDSAVPVTITFYRVLRKNWNNQLKTTQSLPMLHLDQEEKALVRDMNGLSRGSSYCWHRNSMSALRRPFTETLIGGDSGNPAFLVIRGELVLMLTHHYASAGPFYTTHMDAVNAAMTRLGGGYQLTEIDLSVRDR